MPEPTYDDIPEDKRYVTNENGKYYHEAYIRELRSESARRRLENKELMATRLSPEESRALRVELQLTKASVKHGFDAELMSALLAKDGRLADLDPTDADALDQLIEKELAARPALKLGASGAPVAATRSVGMDFTNGGPGIPRREVPTRGDLSGMSSEEIYAAYKSGALNGILGKS